MTRALILCPTHAHRETLAAAIASVRAQTHPDWRLIVVGDGAPGRAEQITEAAAAGDSRIQYRAFPKGERHGEVHRDAVIRETESQFVFQIGDDDIWSPGHLAALLPLLEQADFAHSIQAEIWPGGHLRGRPFGYQSPALRERALNQEFNLTGPSAVGYRRAAYLDLETGWTPAPPGLWTDLHMWRKFFAAQNLRFAFLPQPTVLNFPAYHRSEVTPDARHAELCLYLARGWHSSPTMARMIDYGPLLEEAAGLDNGDWIPAMSKLDARPAPMGEVSAAYDGQIAEIPMSDAQKDNLIRFWRKRQAADGQA